MKPTSKIIQIQTIHIPESGYEPAHVRIFVLCEDGSVFSKNPGITDAPWCVEVAAGAPQEPNPIKREVSEPLTVHEALEAKKANRQARSEDRQEWQLIHHRHTMQTEVRRFRVSADYKTDTGRVCLLGNVSEKEMKIIAASMALYDAASAQVGDESAFEYLRRYSGGFTRIPSVENWFAELHKVISLIES